MTRVLAAATLLTIAAMPAVACGLTKSVSTDAKSSTVASQSNVNHATTPAPSTSKPGKHVPS